MVKNCLRRGCSNRDAIGAKVKLSTTSGELIRHNSGVAFFGQSLKPIHFGLSSMSEINGLEIHWPSGLIENFTNIKSNQTLKATEGQGLVPLNLSPSEKIYGCTDPKSCSYNPLATFNDGSCTYLESNLILGSQNSYFKARKLLLSSSKWLKLFLGGRGVKLSKVKLKQHNCKMEY